MNDPDKIFDLCLKTSTLFYITINNQFVEQFTIKEKMDSEMYLDEPLICNFVAKYEDSVRFTALLYCCSIYYINIMRTKEKYPNINEDYYRIILNQIFSKAKSLGTYHMKYNIDVITRRNEYTEKGYEAINDYLKMIAINVIKFFSHNNNDSLKNLTYNYYINPGVLTFEYFDFMYSPPKILKLEDRKLNRDLVNDIKMAAKLIVPKLSL